MLHWFIRAAGYRKEEGRKESHPWEGTKGCGLLLLLPGGGGTLTNVRSSKFKRRKIAHFLANKLPLPD